MSNTPECLECFDSGFIDGKLKGKQEIIEDLEKWAKNAGEHLLVTIRTCINVIELKQTQEVEQKDG